MSPEQKFIEGLQGNDITPGAGVNRLIIDEFELLMDFTPYTELTVQNYGLRLDYIKYNCRELKPFVNMKDPNNPNKKMKFVVRRDPRNISVLYFYDPFNDRYITVPYRNKSRPTISLWEHKRAHKALEERGKIDSITEEEIFRTHKELKALEEEATLKTKRARRSSERRKINRTATTNTGHVQGPALDDFDEMDEMDEDINPYEIELDG